MSSNGITSRNEVRHIYGGEVTVTAEENLARVSQILAGIPGGAKKAVGNALTRAAAAGRTAAKKPVTEEYAISQGEFLARTRNINHFMKESDGGISVVFGFAGAVIPLARFNTRVSSDGMVTTSVKRGTAGAALSHAFMAQMGSHTGIYEREGVSRFPVKELFGPSTPQMMYSNENVMDAVEDRMNETFEKRIDHEVARILNGWGR